MVPRAHAGAQGTRAAIAAGAGLAALLAGAPLGEPIRLAHSRAGSGSPVARQAPGPGGERDPPLAGSPASQVLALTRDEARLSNLAVPISPGPLPVAAPFRFAGDDRARAAARKCLAAAALYEAGDDATGEQAVVQVVLNRTRHASYPASVCGVVFQGSALATGCQFTFTCDGALNRLPPLAAWRRALAIADAALAGFVSKAVGISTHYHADWVVPRWRDALAKSAVIGPHIFYRLPGAAALPAVARARPLATAEIVDPRIEGFPFRLAVPTVAAPTLLATAQPAPAMAAPPPAPPELAVPGVSQAELKGSLVRLMDERAGAFVLKLAADGYAGSYALVASALCGSRAFCTVFGWRRESQLPSTMPSANAPGPGLGFLFHRDAASRLTQIYWNCREAPRADRSQCLPGTAPTADTAATDSPEAAPQAVSAGTRAPA